MLISLLVEERERDRDRRELGESHVINNMALKLKSILAINLKATQILSILAIYY